MSQDYVSDRLHNPRQEAGTKHQEECPEITIQAHHPSGRSQWVKLW